jgi:hypothetical protein
MLRSVWVSNLDCLVNNIRYLQDDKYEYQQPSEPYKSYKSDKSELGVVNHVRYYDDIGYRPSDTTAIIGAVSKLEHELVNAKFNDSLNEHNELYTKLK